MRTNIPPNAMAACMEAANQSLYTCRSLLKHLAEDKADLEQLHAEAVENGDRREASELMDGIMTYGSTAARLSKREEFLSRRLDHALKCIIRKKLHADDAEGLMALCEDRGMLAERAVLQMVTCTMGNRIVTIAGQDELDDNCWKIGIDLAMMECEPALASSDSLYGPVLERHAGRIFTNAMLAAYGSKMTQLLSTENYRDAVDKEIAKKYATDRDIQDSVSGQIASAIMSIIGIDDKGLQAENDWLKSQLSEASARLGASDNAIRKAVSPVQARADRAERRAGELEAELRAANARNEQLQDALADRDRKLSDAAARLDAANLPELPEAGVIFAGGHPNMTKKLMQDHPGWTFIDGRDVNFPEFRNPIMIFFWDQHISHPTFHRVRKFAPASVPQAYLKSTNLDMLENEMRGKWALAGNVDGAADA